MKEVKIIHLVLDLKMLSAGLLFSCLLFLTCTNFFIYTICDSTEVELLSDLSSEEKMPNSPEEKSTNNNISIQEEYVHDSGHVNDNLAFNHRTHQIIIESNKLSVVHFKLISPPPDAGL